MAGVLSKPDLDQVKAAAKDGAAEALAAAKAAESATDEEQAHISVDFNDILFGLSMTAVFTAVADNPTGLMIATWAQLVLAAWIIALSWFGYRRARAKTPSVFNDFWSIRFAQYMVDATILGVYFVLAHYAAFGGSRDHLTIRPQAFTIFFIFVLYLIWDVLQGIDTRPRTEKLANGVKIKDEKSSHYERAWVRGKITACFTLLVFGLGLLIWFSNPRTNDLVITWCVAYFVAVGAYRLVQEVQENKIETAT